eukprot:5727595-Pyramimonas_sp.AAC.1
MSGDHDHCLLASSAGKLVTVWDPSTQQSRWSVTSPTLVHCVKWNHTNQVVGAAGDDGLISLYHHSSGHNVGRIPETPDAIGQQQTVHSIAFSKGSRYLATGGEGMDVLIWDLKRKVKVKSLLGHSEAVRAVTYSNGDQHIASGGDSGVILLHAQLSGVLLVFPVDERAVDALMACTYAICSTIPTYLTRTFQVLPLIFIYSTDTVNWGFNIVFSTISTLVDCSLALVTCLCYPSSSCKIRWNTQHHDVDRVAFAVTGGIVHAD